MLNELGARIHKTATDHGWWQEERSVGDVIALIHSEASEALEAYREHEMLTWERDEDGKPEGVAYEFADVIIRVLDACHQYGIDIDAAMDRKMAFNETRPYRHGGKRL